MGGWRIDERINCFFICARNRYFFDKKLGAMMAFRVIARKMNNGEYEPIVAFNLDAESFLLNSPIEDFISKSIEGIAYNTGINVVVRDLANVEESMDEEYFLEEGEEIMKHDHKAYSDQTLVCAERSIKKHVDDLTHELQLIREELQRRKNANVKTTN